MEIFQIHKVLLSDFLRDIKTGKIQLPDFQRGWIWDDNHIQDLLASVARSFPIGAVMLLEAGGKVRFQTRPIEGMEDGIPSGQKPDRLILDGQQRLTTLTQALASSNPVQTRTTKGKKIQLHYYFDIQRALASLPDSIADAIVAVDQRRQLRSDFGQKVDLDLSTRDRECKHMHFPCSRIMDPNNWAFDLFKFAPNQVDVFMEFSKKVLKPFQKYHIPVIQLQKRTSKEAVCLVFEKVNTGGVALSVFELITAMYAAENYNLRDDWFGSKNRKVESRKERMEQDGLLRGIRPTDFLQGISLLYTNEIRQKDLADGKTGRSARPISAKRADVLRLPLSAWKRWADDLEKRFLKAAHFLRKQSFYSRRDLPYRTQLVPLAALLAHLGQDWLTHPVHEKLARWFWCGVLGELYGGAVETRIANDFEELLG